MSAGALPDRPVTPPARTGFHPGNLNRGSGCVATLPPAKQVLEGESGSQARRGSLPLFFLFSEVQAGELIYVEPVQAALMTKNYVCASALPFEHWQSQWHTCANSVASKEPHPREGCGEFQPGFVLPPSDIGLFGRKLLRWPLKDPV